jgi:hypothetical protein
MRLHSTDSRAHRSRSFGHAPGEQCLLMSPTLPAFRTVVQRLLQWPEVPSSSQTVSLGTPGRTPPSTTLCPERERQRVWAAERPFGRNRVGQRGGRSGDERVCDEGSHPQNPAYVRDVARPQPISQPGPPSTMRAAITHGPSSRLPGQDSLRNTLCGCGLPRLCQRGN